MAVSTNRGLGLARRLPEPVDQQPTLPPELIQRAMEGAELGQPGPPQGLPQQQPPPAQAPAAAPQAPSGDAAQKGIDMLFELVGTALQLSPQGAQATPLIEQMQQAVAELSQNRIDLGQVFVAATQMPGMDKVGAQLRQLDPNAKQQLAQAVQREGGDTNAVLNLVSDPVFTKRALPGPGEQPQPAAQIQGGQGQDTLAGGPAADMLDAGPKAGKKRGRISTAKRQIMLQALYSITGTATDPELKAEADKLINKHAEKLNFPAPTGDEPEETLSPLEEEILTEIETQEQAAGGPNSAEDAAVGIQQLEPTAQRREPPVRLDPAAPAPPSPTEDPTIRQQAERMAAQQFARSARPAVNFSSMDFTQISNYVAFGALDPDPEIYQKLGSEEFGAPAKNALQGELIKVAASFDLVNEIARRYDPRFLRTEFRTRQDINALQEKSQGIPLVGTELQPKQADDLMQFSQFQAMSGQLLSSYIKSISGATVSDAERATLVRQIPSADEAGFSKALPFVNVPQDSESQFVAKLEILMRSLRLQSARAHYSLVNGIPLNVGTTEDPITRLGDMTLNLDEMPNFMERQLATEIARMQRDDPDMPRQELISRARSWGRDNFGADPAEILKTNSISSMF